MAKQTASDKADKGNWDIPKNTESDGTEGWQKEERNGDIAGYWRLHGEDSIGDGVIGEVIAKHSFTFEGEDREVWHLRVTRKPVTVSRRGGETVAEIGSVIGITCRRNLDMALARYEGCGEVKIVVEGYDKIGGGKTAYRFGVYPSPEARKTADKRAVQVAAAR